jgi:hypothetical protein
MSLVNTVLAGMNEDEKQQMFVELLKECHEHVLWCIKSDPKYDKSVDVYLEACQKLLEYNMVDTDYKSYMESI